MATIVGKLISKKPVELHPVHEQPGYYYVPQGTEFIVKKDGLLHEQKSLLGGLSSKMSLTLSPEINPSITDGHPHEYYEIPNNTEFVFRGSGHGIAARNEVINVFTRVHDHYDEPRLIKSDENDEEITLVAINDFLVQEQDTVKIDLTCDFNPEDILDHLTKVVDDIYDRYHQNHPVCKTGISFCINVPPTRLFVFSSVDNKIIPGNSVNVGNIDIEPQESSLNSPETINYIDTVIAKKLSPPYKVCLPERSIRYKH